MAVRAGSFECSGRARTIAAEAASERLDRSFRLCRNVSAEKLKAMRVLWEKRQTLAFLGRARRTDLSHPVKISL
jgi:hypothetical protein